MTMTKAEDYLNEVIRLQLRKPRKWNWQLSTSKSSPHISLPTIQLYDAKGHLLLQTKDNGGSQRQTWNSSQIDVTKGSRDQQRHLQRCRSDNLDHRINKEQSRNNNSTTGNNKALANSSWDSRKPDSKHLQRCRSDTLNTAGNPYRRAHPDVAERANRSNKKGHNVNYGDRNVNGKLDTTAKEKPEIRHSDDEGNNKGCNTINERNEDSKELHHLQKSKSDILQVKSKKPHKSYPIQPNRSLTGLIVETRHARSRSDDAFTRKMWQSEESIKRAELDGYRNFITPYIPEETKDESKNEDKKTKKNNNLVLATAEEVCFNNKASCAVEVDNPKPIKYSLRGSRAGILVVAEEPHPHTHRRRRRRDGSKSRDRSKTLEQINVERENAVGTTSTENGTSKHFRQVSDPTGAGIGFRNRLRIRQPYCPQDDSKDKRKAIRTDSKTTETKETIPPKVRENGLFYSQSDVFPFKHLIDGCEKLDRNCNYSVQHPVTTNNNECHKNSETITENPRKKKLRKVQRRHTDGGASSSCNEENDGKPMGHLIKAVGPSPRHNHAAPRQAGDGSGGGDLLQLVRRLTSAPDHVSMGANVSRHSAKGLSGRRSQSSGSICNGKGGSSSGRHSSGDGKICSSLPNYLDDSEAACNNNHHDCEKQPLEDDRIPPLGDGAPLHWKFSDQQTAALCDQGYGSERSPEEEFPPPLPAHDQCHRHLEPHACYPFVTPESTFTVKLTKGSRGLGLSVTGGVDTTGSWPGLIRIKRLFPHQPASACGLLSVGDLLLEVNGVTLTGLTNYEALEVLRTASNQVELVLCRPPPDVLNCVSPISEVPPPPPRREPPNSLNICGAYYGGTPEDEFYHGEFEITLTKIQGSLGFTLRKEDDSALGHYVRALVREPALTDGRIRAGDKIIAVNDVEISDMTHEQAVQYLRQCGDIVKLRLYRDSAQTPVAALSPTETTPRTSFSRKAHLRQEAVDMLNDIAVRKLIPGSQDRRSMSPNSSPRRLRRSQCPSDASQDSSLRYIAQEEQFHEGMLHKCSHPFDDDAFNSLFSIESDDGDKPSRPSSLDLYNPNQTPVAARKPRFNFSLAHNAYELNNLDADVLDAPNLTYNLGNEDANSAETECGDRYLQEPVSMPHIPLDNGTAFSYKNPAYQSAHPQCGGESSDETSGTLTRNHKHENASIKKRKEAVLKEEEEAKPRQERQPMPMKEEYEVHAIELNRGWNSRLGFSLQGAAGVTYVSAVHADSVAAKDGRIKPGDLLLKVNDESVEHMSTTEIIDLLRIVRGPVCIVVKRVKSNEDCPKSNAEN